MLLRLTAFATVLAALSACMPTPGAEAAAEQTIGSPPPECTTPALENPAVPTDEDDVQDVARSNPLYCDDDDL